MFSFLSFSVLYWDLFIFNSSCLCACCCSAFFCSISCWVFCHLLSFQFRRFNCCEAGRSKPWVYVSKIYLFSTGRLIFWFDRSGEFGSVMKVARITVIISDYLSFWNRLLGSLSSALRLLCVAAEVKNGMESTGSLYVANGPSPLIF